MISSLFKFAKTISPICGFICLLIEDKKTLWQEISKTLLAHFSWEQIESKVEELNFAIDAMGEINGDDSVMVKVINGKKQAILTFSNALLKDKNLNTDEEIMPLIKQY